MNKKINNYYRIEKFAPDCPWQDSPEEMRRFKKVSWTLEEAEQQDDGYWWAKLRDAGGQVMWAKVRLIKV